MFPIRDAVRPWFPPIASLDLIAINVFIFLVEISLGTGQFVR